MKTILHQLPFFLLVIIVFASCQKQETFKISGFISGIPDGTIIDLYEVEFDIAERIQSDTIKNGKFVFLGRTLLEPVEMNLMVRDSELYTGNCRIWIENTTINIEGHGKFPAKWIVKSNVKEQLASNEIEKSSIRLVAAIDSLVGLSMSNWDNQELSVQLGEQIDSLSSLKSSLDFEQIKKNPNSLSALQILYQIAKFNENIDKQQIKEVFEKVKPDYKSSLYAEGITSLLSENKTPNIGDSAVSYSLLDNYGNKYYLKWPSEKTILLFFWSKGCSFCKKAFPDLKQVNKEYGSQIIIAAVNVDVNVKKWKEQVSSDSLPFVNLSDGKGTFAGIYQSYGIEGFPTFILVNPNGIIVDKWFGFKPGLVVSRLKKANII